MKLDKMMLFTTVNTMFPKPLSIPETSLEKDFSFVGEEFKEAGDNLRRSIHEFQSTSKNPK